MTSSPPDSRPFRGLRHESGERPSCRLVAAEVEIDSLAPARLRKTDPSPLEIHRARSLADLDAAEEVSGGCRALARDIGTDESAIRIVQTHPQRNSPWWWLRAMSGRAWVRVIVCMARDRSPVVRSMLRQELDALDEDLAEPVSA